jgi:hypothetical protein
MVVVARKDLWKKRVVKCCFFKTAGEKLPADYSKEKICPQLSKNSCPLF